MYNVLNALGTIDLAVTNLRFSMNPKEESLREIETQLAIIRAELLDFREQPRLTLTKKNGAVNARNSE